MKKTKIIKKRYEFKRLYSKGKFFSCKNVTVYILKNQTEYNRLAIAIGKKNGKAVKRNHIKRLIKENYTKMEDFLKVGYNILISVNKKCEIEKVDFYEIKADLEKAFKNSEIWL